MDVLAASKWYINKMVGGENDNGRFVPPNSENSKLKILLLDKETTAIISMASSQTLLLQHEIFLVDRLENNQREKMRHLKCIVFVRPTPENVQLLVNELSEPKYNSYELYFSNLIKRSYLERIAEADIYETVTKVMEIFSDFMVINHDLFTLNLDFPPNIIYGDSPDTWDASALKRVVEGLFGVILTLKKHPLIRYETNSKMAKNLALDLQYQITNEQSLFDFKKTDTPPILLILDRKNDPVTPLLTPWSYQAMVHELIGIHNGRIDLSDVPDIRAELKETVLSEDNDPFFRKNMDLNFGDLGANIKEYVNHYQSKTKSNQNIDSIADMKRFVEEYPEFRKLSGNVSKHVTLVSELSRRVEKDKLLEISELEQSLACNDSHSQDVKTLQTFIQDPDISNDAKVRLVMLYGLRYEKHPQNSLPVLLDLLVAVNVPQSYINAIVTLMRLSGSSNRLQDLYVSDSLFSRNTSTFKGLKGVENVYTQHIPLLERILGWLVKGKLRENEYPFIERNDSYMNATTISAVAKEKSQDIIVFIIGGATYEETRLISQINSTTPSVRIVLGGTSVLRTSNYLKTLEELGNRWSTNVLANKAPANAKARLATRIP